MPETPFLPDLPVGAEIYGLTGNTVAEVAAALGSLPALDVNGLLLSQAAAGLVRMHLGPVGFANDFTGFDMLLYLNLSDDALSAPAMAAGGALQSLLARGYANNPTFGGSGPFTLTSLGSDGVYGTLIPAGTTSDFAISLMDGTQVFSATAAALANGEALYVVPEPATWVLLAVAGLALPVAAGRRRRASISRCGPRTWAIQCSTWCGLLAVLGSVEARAEFVGGDVLLNNFYGTVEQTGADGDLKQTFTGTGQYWVGVDLSPDGKLVTAYRNAGTTTSGVVILLDDGTEQSSFSFPNPLPGDVAVFGDGTIAVSATNFDRVDLFSPAGTSLGFLNKPGGMGGPAWRGRRTTRCGSPTATARM